MSQKKRKKKREKLQITCLIYLTIAVQKIILVQ